MSGAVSVSAGPVLVVPAFEAGLGSGHLVRSCLLVRELRALGRETFLFYPPRTDRCPGEWHIRERKTAAERSWALIVLDRFATPSEEYCFWSDLAPVIGIDEGGSSREVFDFLIDLLPPSAGTSPPNIADPSLLPLPVHRRTAGRFEPKVRAGSPAPWNTRNVREPLKLLISFGGEDISGLAGMTAKGLSPLGDIFDITLVSPKAAGQAPVLRERRFSYLPDLRERLADYDLVITHFGLTAFEALHAGVSVLLVSPSVYHEKLALISGLVSAGIGAKGARRVKDLLCPRMRINHAFLKNLSRRCEAVAGRCNLDTVPGRKLSGLIAGFSPQAAAACPVCGKKNKAGRRKSAGARRLMARFCDRTYFRCPLCGMIYMNRLTPQPIEYERDYFFDFYKKQYGKTYIDDFPNLMAAGRRRLAVIARIPAQDSKKLLDIGCAYGPFLAAAREAGFSPIGIDPAEDAVAYIREKLRLEAYQGFFPETRLPELLTDSRFDLVSLWFVIEHFRDPGKVLSEIKRILKKGGVLAFSTPSFSGISGRKNAVSFLKQSPADHRTIWSPAFAAKFLKSIGFTVKQIVITGHHPERFPLIGRFLDKKRGPLYAVCTGISRVFSLGDTFEIYAVKD
jgi:2-polyprenyl-3-methyl-5-hydroxy-6-metoxy-1,4-benzoquinol methylase